MTSKPSLVGHRGQPQSFPENSLEGFEYAVQSGATYIETDIHVTADGIVVLSHDENLNKLTGKNISITKSDYSDFKDIPAGYPKRFSNTFSHCRIATLNQFSDLLQNWPKVTCFIEIKQDSLSCFGNTVVDRVIEALEAIASQCVLISFDYEAMVYAKNKYHKAVGWVLPDWSLQNQHKAEQLAPDYLFVDTDFCPQNKPDLWTGSWKWVVYTVNTVTSIKKYTDLGINIIETDCISELSHAYDTDANNNKHNKNK